MLSTAATCFERIDVEFTLASPDATEHDVQQTLQTSEASLCPVWAMIKGNVEVCAGVRIVEQDGLD